MLKAKELATPTSCLNKAEHDEPIFVLRAKDPIAAQTVRLWATMASSSHHEESKIVEAMELAKAMDNWRIQNVPTNNALERH